MQRGGRKTRNNTVNYADVTTAYGSAFAAPPPPRRSTPRTPAFSSARGVITSSVTPDLSFGSSSTPSTSTSGYASTSLLPTSSAGHQRKRKQAFESDDEMEHDLMDGDEVDDDMLVDGLDGDYVQEDEEGAEEDLEDDVFIAKPSTSASTSRQRKSKSTRSTDAATFAAERARFANHIATHGGPPAESLTSLAYAGLDQAQEQAARKAAEAAGKIWLSLNLGELDRPSYFFVSWDYFRFDPDIIIASAASELVSDANRHQQLLRKGRFYTDLLGALHRKQDQAGVLRNHSAEHKSSPPRTYTPHKPLTPTSMSKRVRNNEDMAGRFGPPPKLPVAWTSNWEAERARDRAVSKQRDDIFGMIVAAAKAAMEEDGDTSLEVHVGSSDNEE